MTRCFFASQSNYVFTACHFGREIFLTRTRTFLGHTRTVSTLHSSLYTLSACCVVVVVNYFSSRSAHFPAFSWSVDNCVDQHQLQHNNANQILVFSFFLLFFTAVFLILFVFSFNWFLRYLWASLWGDNCTLTPTAATTTTLVGKQQQQQQHWRAITTAAAEQRTPTVRYKSTPTLLRFRLLINFGLCIPFFMDFVWILLHNFEDFPVILFLFLVFFLFWVFLSLPPQCRPEVVPFSVAFLK